MAKRVEIWRFGIWIRDGLGGARTARTRTWTEGPDPVTARCRTRGPAVDFDGPADAVDLSAGDEAVSASSADATQMWP